MSSFSPTRAGVCLAPNPFPFLAHPLGVRCHASHLLFLELRTCFSFRRTLAQATTHQSTLPHQVCLNSAPSQIPSRGGLIPHEILQPVASKGLGLLHPRPLLYPQLTLTQPSHRIGQFLLFSHPLSRHPWRPADHVMLMVCTFNPTN